MLKRKDYTASRSWKSENAEMQSLVLSPKPSMSLCDQQNELMMELSKVLTD